MNSGSEHLNGCSQWVRVELKKGIVHIRCGKQIFTLLCQVRPYGEINARYRHAVVASLRESWHRAAGEASAGVSSDCSCNRCASCVAGRLFVAGTGTEMRGRMKPVPWLPSALVSTLSTLPL
jgi:hypothetical protein